MSSIFLAKRLGRNIKIISEWYHFCTHFILIFHWQTTYEFGFKGVGNVCPSMDVGTFTMSIAHEI